MSRWRPSIQEERWLQLANRWPEYAHLAPSVAGRGDWRRTGWVARLALAALGLVIVAAAYAVGFAIRLPAATATVGLLLLAVAEYLVVRRRLWAAGIEEALWLGGAIGLCFWHWEGRGMPDWLPSLLLLLAGLRLGNAWWLLASALGLAWWWERLPASQVSWCWLALALVALLAQGWRLRRPWHERVAAMFMIVLPVAAYLDGYRSAQLMVDGIAVDAMPGAWLVGALAVLGGIAGWFAWRRRAHPPLWCALACLGCAAHWLAMHSALSLQARLLLDGVLLLAATLWIERRLRTPWRGIDAAGEDSERLALLQAVGAAALAPTPLPASPAGPHGGGGGFAGGGSSGGY